MASPARKRRPSSFRGSYSDDVHVSAKEIATDVLRSLGFGDDVVSQLLGRVSIAGPTEPFLPCVFRVTDAMTALQLSVASLANLWGLRRNGYLQDVRVSTETASMQFFSAFSFEISARKMFPNLPGPEDRPLLWREWTPSLTGFAEPDVTARFGSVYWQLWETGDGRYVFLSPFINPYPPEKLLELVGFQQPEIPRFFSLLEKDEGIPEALEAMRRALKRIPSAMDLEKAMFKEKAGGCWAIKTLDEFLDGDQGVWSAAHDQIHVEQVGTDKWGPAGFGEPVKEGEGLYKGIKVVEMTRIVMGPVISSFLANMGADVVRIASETVNEMPNWNFTQTTNKRCIALNLKDPKDKAVMDRLLDEADVVLQNNAYGAVERLGYGFDDLCKRFANRKKGFVYCEGNSLGFTGPWASSGGFDQVGQICSGAAFAMGREVHGHGEGAGPAGVKPHFFPSTICDATTGMSGAVGLHAALYRRATEGGSYRVRVALARSGMFYQELGMYQSKALRKKARFFGVMDAFFQYHEALRDTMPHLFSDEHWMRFRDSPFGGVPLRIVRPAFSLSRNPVAVRIQPRPLGYDSTPASRIAMRGELRWLDEQARDVERDGDEWWFRTVEGGADSAKL
ncbi:CoA-transferase family III domain-containing protein [Hyaloraphidium curvatum]|nr:CoA-transferase family III domain-containing protein [Hyaloraphidium curvatum]